MDEKRISTNDFIIENNIISFNDVILQISNISCVSIESAPKKKFNFKSLGIFALGLFGATQFKGNIQGFGITLIIAVAIYVCLLLTENSSITIGNSKEVMNTIITGDNNSVKINEVETGIKIAPLAIARRAKLLFHIHL